ncbi:bifunctional 3-(3-hydroxy-phenyl)propionate/3-hydroxycinnamic acid hydroxylase [soil metagenome]
MMRTNETATLAADVLIVGAGPVGLLLANLLGMHGVDALVIERNDGTVREPRAVTLDDESLRTLQSAGLSDAVVQDVVLGYGVQYFSWRGKPFASIQPTRQEFGYPKRNAFNQPRLERTLADGLQRFPQVRVRFGHELESFEQDGDGVRCDARTADGLVRIDARWVVGCDGGRSSVRALCGIALEGATYAERWLIVDLAERTLPLRHTQTFCDPLRPAIRLPGPHGTLRYEFMLHAGEDDAFALHEPRLREWIAQRHPEDAVLPLVRKAVYVFHARVAERWRHGRVLLAGDAAHLTPPFAGQGLNSGLRDAANLGWKLAAVTRWGLGSDAALMDSYEAERRPHAQALIRMALRIGAFMQPKSRASAAVMQALLRTACLLPPVRDHVLQLRFKPKARLRAGWFERPSNGAHLPEMLPQPRVDRPDRSRCRLDELLGSGFAVIGWDSPAFRMRAHALAPPGVPVRVVALTPTHDDFLPARQAEHTDLADLDSGVQQARDDSGAVDAFLHALHADALVLRPDRYWCRVVPAGTWAPAPAALPRTLPEPIESTT